MARKLIFSLFFFVFMAILATCSMLKEESPKSPAIDPVQPGLSIPMEAPSTLDFAR